MNLPAPILALLLTLSSGLGAQQLARYTGTLSVDKEEETYAAELVIDFASFAAEDTLKLFLQGGAHITSLRTGDGAAIDYAITDENLYGKEKAIIIPAAGVVDKRISISYTNRFTEIENPQFPYDPDWFEFNIYTTWFPWNIAYGLFEYRIRVEADDPVIAAGMGEDGKVVSSPTPSFDIPLLVSAGARREGTAGDPVQLYHYGIADSTVATIGDRARRYFDYCTQTFGAPTSDELTIIVSASDRDLNYARPRFISLALDSAFGRADDKTLAHEIGHLWWSKADLAGWDDWLNEAFAEFTALLIYRDTYGETQFAKNRAETAEWLRKLDLPPLWGIDKLDPRSNQVLTYRGAHCLWQLEERIGRPAMADLLRATHTTRVTTTPEFLALLAERHGEATRAWLEETLKE